MFRNKKEGGVCNTELMSLKRRVSNLEKEVEFYIGNEFFRKGDKVAFIYDKKLLKGEIIGIDIDLPVVNYAIRVGEVTFEVNQKCITKDGLE